MSVPYLSPLRRVVSVARRSDRRTVQKAETEQANGRQFFQYAYTRGEFKSILGAAGFEVVATKGYSLLWGLSELPFVDQALNKRASARSVSMPASIQASDKPRSSATAESD